MDIKIDPAAIAAANMLIKTASRSTVTISNCVESPASPAIFQHEFYRSQTFLRDHYQQDDLDADKIRRDIGHWEGVAGDPAKYPKADLVYIDRFCDAALIYLTGVKA